MILRILAALVAMHLLCGCGGPLNGGWGNATALHRAAFNGESAGIKTAITRGDDPNAAASIPAWSWCYFTPSGVRRQDDAARSGDQGPSRRCHVLPAAGASFDPRQIRMLCREGRTQRRSAGWRSAAKTPLPDNPFEGGTERCTWPPTSSSPAWQSCSWMRVRIPTSARPTGKRTPLMSFWWHATPRGPEGPEVARLLLSAGADPTLETNPYTDVTGVIITETALSRARGAPEAGYREGHRAGMLGTRNSTTLSVWTFVHLTLSSGQCLGESVEATCPEDRSGVVRACPRYGRPVSSRMTT